MSDENEHDAPLTAWQNVCKFADQQQAKEALRAAEERCCVAAMVYAEARFAWLTYSKGDDYGIRESRRLADVKRACDLEVLAAGSALARLRGGT